MGIINLDSARKKEKGSLMKQKSRMLDLSELAKTAFPKTESVTGASAGASAAGHIAPHDQVRCDDKQGHTLRPAVLRRRAPPLRRSRVAHRDNARRVADARAAPRRAGVGTRGSPSGRWT